MSPVRIDHRIAHSIRRGARDVRLCLGIVVTIGTAACAPSPDPQRSDFSTSTVEYYRAHKAERTAALAACANDPARLAHTRECVNAKAAGRIADIGSSRDLPPLDLPTPARPGRGRAEEHADDGRAADETAAREQDGKQIH